MGKQGKQFQQEKVVLPAFDVLKAEREVMGRKVVLIAKVGSANCNLHDEMSDDDYKVYVLPTYDDLYNGNRFSEQHLGKVDYTVNDIRDFEKQLVTSPVNHIEILYSVDVESLASEVNALFEMRESIASLNLPALFDSAMGRYKVAFNGMKKGTGATAHLVEIHGYCTKSFLLAYRSLDFLLRYHANGFSSYEKAFRYTEEERMERLSFKYGSLTKEEAEAELASLLEKVEVIKPEYRSKPVNEEAKNDVHALLLQLVVKHVKEGA